MADELGPKLWHPLTVVAKSIVNNEAFSLLCPLSSESDDDERRHQLLQLCVRLLHAVQDPIDHYQKLDTILSNLLPNTVDQRPRAFNRLDDVRDFEVSRAALLLRRLPRLPQQLLAFRLASRLPSVEPDTMWQRMVRARWSPDWLVENARSRVQAQVLPTDASSVMEELRYASNLVWNDLIVTNYMDTNSLVLLIRQSVCMEGSNWELSKRIYAYLNVLAELLDVYEDLCNGLASSEARSTLKAALFPTDNIVYDSQRLNIIKAFLWTAWQRSTMLHFYTVIGAQLQNGASQEWSNLLAVRGVRRLEELGDDRIRALYRGPEANPYLCNWAFELLRRSRSALCLDFRRLFERFSCHFAGRSGRCIRDSDDTCVGDQPNSCQRFTGAETLAQSAHKATCNKSCGRIGWNESSYRATRGPRAVCVEGSEEEMQYRVASECTLAISHVWAHGQGGRPEEGINRCLHELYRALARRHACDSYWIDSACIPTEEKLRKEAIANINDIFARSKVVVLSDEDVQSVDLQSLSIHDLETVLSVLLVCDWNVRAWTLLEATRGNRTVHLLCKNSVTISLLELLNRVWKEGAVDLAVLIGSAEHLLPLANPMATRSLEDAGYALSQRHASRVGDDVLIWALLNNAVGAFGAAELWRTQQCVRTSFLMSSAPRVEDAPGLSWAPSTPSIVPQVRCVRCSSLDLHYVVRYHNYDGKGSYVGHITSKGLLSKWLFKDMDCSAVEYIRNTYCSLLPSSWLAGASQYLDVRNDIPEDSEIYDWPDIALACLIIMELLESSRVRVLKTTVTDGTAAYTGGDNRGDYTGGVVAICSSKREVDGWQWRGVYQWGGEEPFLDWTIGEMLIV